MTPPRPQILDELGSELLRAIRAQEEASGAHDHAPPSGRWPAVAGPRHWRRRSLLLTLAALLGLAAVATAATLIVGRGAPIAPAPPGTVPPELRPVPGSERLNGLDVPDPDGGPAWDVRTSRSTTGAICTTVGQLLDGQLGLVGLDHRFRALPAGAADTCSTPQRRGATLAGARAFPAGRGLSDLTVVSGVAAPSVRRAVVIAGAHRQTLKLGPADAFLAVLRGTPEQLRPRLVLTGADGRTSTLRFDDSGEFFAPDPSRGAPWALQRSAGRHGLICIGAVRARGPDSPDPATPFAAFMPTPTVPAHCGTPGTSFADVRRFVPQPMRAPMQIRWGANPARTVVWGAAASAGATVTLRGAGAPRTIAVDPKTHGFLAVLDGHVDPRALRLTVDGRPAAPGRGRSGRALTRPAVPAWRSLAAATRGLTPPPFHVLPGTSAIVGHAADPTGGPAWAMRSFAATIPRNTKVYPKHASRRLTCFAIGVAGGGGRLSEPLPGGRSRRIGDDRGASCYVERSLAGRLPGPLERVYVDDPGATDPKPTRIVVSGVLGSHVRSAELLGAGAPRPLALGPLGSYLVVLGPDQIGATLRVRATDADGRVREARREGLQLRCPLDPSHTMRVADPGGGPPWVAGATPGCTFLGRVIADQLVSAPPGQTYVMPGPQAATSGASFGLHRRGKPVSVSVQPQVSLGAPTPRTSGEIERRTLAGDTVIQGHAAADVVSVTLRTPRDVRTLRPVGGVFLAVYDGFFYDGDLVVTAHLRDRRSTTIRQGLDRRSG